MRDTILPTLFFTSEHVRGFQSLNGYSRMKSNGARNMPSSHMGLKKKINPICETAKETQMFRMDFWTLWERERWDDLGEWH